MSSWLSPSAVGVFVVVVGVAFGWAAAVAVVVVVVVGGAAAALGGIYWC